LPAIAISLASWRDDGLETAGKVARSLVARLTNKPLPPDTILNVNVPPIPAGGELRFSSTRLGHRHRAEPVVRGEDPRGRPIYWVGAAGSEADAGPGTDFHAVANGRVSVTPLQVDLTRHSSLAGLETWLSQGEQ
jgi:5'-nucleotidase